MPANTATQSHTLRAVIELRQRILSGELAGGTRLLEVAMAEELEISRTPVREAMSRLAEEGLLERSKGGGFLVRSFALADIVDTIELRGILEGTAARFAAERGVGEAALDQIANVVAQLDICVGGGIQDIDLDEYSDLNQQFHSQLAALSGSAVLIREIERVTHFPFASPSAFSTNHRHVEDFRRSLPPAQEQHRALIDAIRRREGTRAESIAREHTRAARRNVELMFGTDTHQQIGLPSLTLLAD